MAERGWMPGVTRVETAARGGYGIAPGAMVADTVVFHCIDGWLSTMLLWAAEDPVHHQVSYHFVLPLEGGIVQFVPIFTPAWHAGRLDDTTQYPPTWTLWRPLVSPNAHTIAIAAEGLHDAGNVWNKDQMAAAAEVQRWVSAETGFRATEETIIGHCEIAPYSRAHDPGPRWFRNAIIADASKPPLPLPLGRVAGMREWALAKMGMGGRRVLPPELVRGDTREKHSIEIPLRRKT